MPLLDKLLKDKPKSVYDTISKLISGLNALEVRGDTKSHEKALESVSKYLQYLKVHVFGDEDREVTKESALELTKELMTTDLLYLLTKHLASFDFEARKDAAQIFGATVRIRDSDDKSPGAQYVLRNPYIVQKLCAG